MKCVNKIKNFFLTPNYSGNGIVRQVKRARENSNIEFADMLSMSAIAPNGLCSSAIYKCSIDSLVEYNKLVASKEYQDILKRAKSIYGKK